MAKNKFKVVIGYPPIEQEKGVPLLSQNRQFQYFNSPTYIYPMVPAYAATVAKKAGYKVRWMDGIAENKTYKEWQKQLVRVKPDYLLLETKAPVIKQHWQIVDGLKAKLPKTKIIMVGDQITYLPEETLKNCSVDYLLLGGDYDFLLTEFLDAVDSKKPLPPGIWGKKGDKSVKLPKGATKKGMFWTTG